MRKNKQKRMQNCGCAYVQISTVRYKGKWELKNFSPVIQYIASPSLYK